MHRRVGVDLHDRGGGREVQDAGDADEDEHRHGHPDTRRERQQEQGDPEQTAADQHVAQVHELAVGDHERSSQRADAEERVEEGEGRVALVQRPLDEQRQLDVEVVAEGADHHQHDERDAQARSLADVPDRGAHGALGGLRRRLGDAVQLVGAHHRERDDHEHVYDAASTAKHQPYPTVTTRTPASAGPKIRDAFTIAL